MPTLEDAIALALQAHAGHKDKAGKPYILHPLRVMMRMKSAETMMVAILHDIRAKLAAVDRGVPWYNPPIEGGRR